MSLRNFIAIIIWSTFFIVIACVDKQSDGPAPLPVRLQPQEPTIINISKMDSFCRYYIQKNDYIKVETSSSSNCDCRINTDIYFDAPCGMYNIGDTLKIIK